MPDTEVTTTTTESATTPVATTPETPVPPPPPPPPVTHSHSERLKNLAREYGIPPEVAETIPADELRADIAERQLEARDRAIRAAVNPPPQTPAAPAVDEFALPKEMVEELSELNPTLLKAINLMATAAKNKTEKLEAELRKTQTQSSGSAFAAQVAAEMNRFPDILGTNPAPGSVEAERREALLSHLASVEQASGRTLGLDAIEKAVKRIYGVVTKPAPASPPPPPAPTPTARPTNRVNVGDGELDKEGLVDLWTQAFREAEERDRATSANGSANRP